MHYVKYKLCNDYIIHNNNLLQQHIYVMHAYLYLMYVFIGEVNVINKTNDENKIDLQNNTIQSAFETSDSSEPLFTVINSNDHQSSSSSNQSKLSSTDSVDINDVINTNQIDLNKSAIKNQDNTTIDVRTEHNNNN